MTRTYQYNRQELICQVAAEIIAEQGLDKLTFREIAAKCGISKGVVEHHFKDKNDILRKTLEWANRRFLEKEERLTAKKRGIAAARERLRCMLPLTEESAKEWKFRVHCWGMAVTSSPDDQIGMGLRLAGARERFCQDIREAIERGEVPAQVDPMAAANMLLHLAAGVACNMLMEPDYYNKTYRTGIVSRAIENLRKGNL